MTVQDLKICLCSVYNARNVDLMLSREEQLSLLDRKYPVKNHLGDIGIRARVKSVLATFEIESSAQEYLDAVQLRQLTDQLYLEYGMFGTGHLTARDIVRVLRYHLTAGSKYSSKAEAVEKLFDYAFDLYLLDPEIYSGPNGDEALDRQVRAAKYLRRFISQDWSIQYGRIVMDKSGMEELQQELERQITRSGGLTVLRALWEKEFLPRYDQQMDRYFILRPKRESRDYLTLPEAAVPANYLIQLAVKQIVSPIGADLPPASNIGNILKIAQDMMTVLRLSDAENMSDFFVPPKQMPEYITDNAQYDSLCIPFQYTPGFCEWLIERFYLPFAHQAGLTALKRSYLPVVRWCLKQRPLSFFKAEDIRHGTGLGARQIQSVLDICAQKQEDVNRDFRSLADKITTQRYPLIRLPDNTYFQLDPHLSGYAFCECIYRQLKSGIRDFDRNLGIPLEKLIKNKLAEKQMRFSCGHYMDEQGRDRDCDVVLEGTDRILFMEIKKRPLPEKFQQGDDIEIFNALADGMVCGQVQALRHKVNLEQKKTLLLYSDSKHENLCGSISHNGRRVYTLSICLPEYAFFTTAVIAQKVFSLLNYNIDTANPALSHRLDRLNKLADEFRTIVQVSGATDLKELLHNSAFRSLHQLWTVLELCETGDVDKLISRLVCDCTVATYNLDFYHSLKCVLQLEGHINTL